MGGKPSKEQKPTPTPNQTPTPEPAPSPKKQPIKQQKVEEVKQNIKQAVKEAQSQPQPKEGIKEMFERIGGGILSGTSFIKDTTRTYSQKIRAETEATNKQYIVPMKSCYNKIPEQITNMKFDIISNYSFNQRFLTVNLLALSTALITFRRLHNVELLSNSLRALRNTGFVYLGGGLFISPQMYNPVMKNN